MSKPTSLRDFHGDCKPSGTQIAYKFCPVCGDDRYKTFVNPDNGKWICFSGACGARGVVDMGMAAEPRAAGQDILDAMRRDWPPAPELVEEIDLPPFHELTFAARKYLTRRGIDEESTRRLGLVEWEDKSRILIPFFSKEGALIYWTSRRYSDRLGQGPKYLTAPGKHPLFTREGSSTILAIVEGVFDAIAVERAGYSAVALGGKSLPTYLVRNLLTLAGRHDTIVVALDSDALDASLRIRAQLSDRMAVKIVTPPTGRDPGDMEPGEIQEMLCTKTT